jgi:Photosystem II protein Y (PsbY)
MDQRLFIVFAPALVAASWALYNIGRVLIQQVQKTLAR